MKIREIAWTRSLKEKEENIANETYTSVLYLMRFNPPGKYNTVSLVTARAVFKDKREHIFRMMKLDWHD